MGTETKTEKHPFGMKKNGHVFLAAIKLVTMHGAFLFNRKRVVDGMTIELKIFSPNQKSSSKRRWWRRNKMVTTISVMIHENGRVVFDASSKWKQSSGRKHGWIRTFHQDLWTLRLMRAARKEDYLKSVSTDIYRKATVLLSEQAEACGPLASEMKSLPTKVVRRVFESAEIEVRGFENNNIPNKDGIRFKTVKVVHKGEEVYEGIYYTQDLSSAKLPDSPKFTVKLVFGDWQKTLECLGVEQGGQQ